jgi:hypothetical protein
MELDFSAGDVLADEDQLDFATGDEPVAMDFSQGDEPLISDDRTTNIRGKNTTSNALQDIGRFFAPIATAGFNALGQGIGQTAAGGDFVEGAVEGAQDNEFLGMGLDMETTAGKWVEDKMSKALTAVREFGGEKAPQLLKNETSRNVLKALPSVGPLVHLYESLDDDKKTAVEGALSAAGASAPELLLTLVGGKAAKKATDKPLSKVDSLGDEILSKVDDEVAPVSKPLEPDAQMELPFTDDKPRAKQPDLFEDQAAQALDETSNQGELFPNEDKLTEPQVSQADADALHNEMPLQNRPDVGERIEALSPQIQEIIRPLGGVGKKGFGQGGAIDFNTLMPMKEVDEFTNNASGESAASSEAISRLSDQNSKGIKMFELDPERGSMVPLVTADRVDSRAPKGKAVVQMDKDGNVTVIENNSRFGNVPLANRSKSMLGGTGKKGFGQGGAINLGGKGEGSPLLNALDKGLGVLSTRIGNISQPVLHRAVKFEQGLLGNTHKRIAGGDDFLTRLEALPKEAREPIKSALLNNDTTKLGDLFATLGPKAERDFVKDFLNVRKTLDDTGSDLMKVGRLEGLRKGYFPRIVTDYKGLLDSIGAKHKSELEKQLVKVDDPLEASKIINNYLRSNFRGPYKPGFAKERKLNDIPPELEKFYASPAEAYHTYVRQATHEIETAKFFGKEAIKDPETGKLNVDDSIGNVVLKELNEGKITGEQAQELTDMLKSRFGPGRRGSNPLLQDVKNIANLGLLGNVVSATTQGGDLVVGAYLNGLRPSMMAGIRALAGKNKVSLKDFGLLDHISEEFVNSRKSAQALNKMFKLSGFSAIDKFGKDVILNSTLDRAQDLVKTPEGTKKLASVWEKRFGEDFPQLVEDLKNGENTDLTNTLVFSQLSKVQPITKLEFPQKYLDMPNGRVIYMLKSFVIKQLDLVRNDAYNKIREGKVKEGLGNLARYSILLGTAGATTGYIKDWMMGRDFDPELSDIPENVLKTFGWSDYISNKVSEGKIGEATRDLVLPPYKMYDEIVGDILKGEAGKSINYIPLFGKILYNREFGGAEEYNKKKQDKEFDKMKEELGL